MCAFPKRDSLRFLLNFLFQQVNKWKSTEFHSTYPGFRIKTAGSCKCSPPDSTDPIALLQDTRLSDGLKGSLASFTSCDNLLQKMGGMWWLLMVIIPIGPMYGICANIGGILMVNVTIYSILMVNVTTYTIHGSYGICHYRSFPQVPT